MSEYIVEAWWHRLLKVLGAIVVLWSVGIYFLIKAPGLEKSEYIYNFEDGYEEQDSIEHDCHIDYSCGRYFSKMSLSLAVPENFKEKANRRDKESHDKKCRSEANNQSVICKLGVVFETPLQDHVKYKIKSYYIWSKILWIILGGAIVGTVAWVSFLVIYKIILYIVYGHVRIRKH